jgi:hypothetical protein
MYQMKRGMTESRTSDVGDRESSCPGFRLKLPHKLVKAGNTSYETPQSKRVSGSHPMPQKHN